MARVREEDRARLGQLIEAVTDIERGSENFRIALDFLVQNVLVFHKFLDPHERAVMEELEGLATKFHAHSLASKKEALQRIVAVLRRRSDAQPWIWSALLLLLRLAERPSGAESAPVDAPTLPGRADRGRGGAGEGSGREDAVGGEEGVWADAAWEEWRRERTLASDDDDDDDNDDDDDDDDERRGTKPQLRKSLDDDLPEGRETGPVPRSVQVRVWRGGEDRGPRVHHGGADIASAMFAVVLGERDHAIAPWFSTRFPNSILVGEAGAQNASLAAALRRVARVARQCARLRRLGDSFGGRSDPYSAKDLTTVERAFGESVRAWSRSADACVLEAWREQEAATTSASAPRHLPWSWATAFLALHDLGQRMRTLVRLASVAQRRRRTFAPSLRSGRLLSLLFDAWQSASVAEDGKPRSLASKGRSPGRREPRPLPAVLAALDARVKEARAEAEDALRHDGVDRWGFGPVWRRASSAPVALVAPRSPGRHSLAEDGRRAHPASDACKDENDRCEFRLPSTAHVVQTVFLAALHPYWHMLDRWVREGRLEDSHREMFVLPSAAVALVPGDDAQRSATPNRWRAGVGAPEALQRFGSPRRRERSFWAAGAFHERAPPSPHSGLPFPSSAQSRTPRSSSRSVSLAKGGRAARTLRSRAEPWRVAPWGRSAVEVERGTDESAAAERSSVTGAAPDRKRACVGAPWMDEELDPQLGFLAHEDEAGAEDGSEAHGGDGSEGGNGGGDGSGRSGGASVVFVPSAAPHFLRPFAALLFAAGRMVTALASALARSTAETGGEVPEMGGFSEGQVGHDESSRGLRTARLAGWSIRGNQTLVHEGLCAWEALLGASAPSRAPAPRTPEPPQVTLGQAGSEPLLQLRRALRLSGTRPDLRLPSAARHGLESPSPVPIALDAAAAALWEATRRVQEEPGVHAGFVVSAREFVAHGTELLGHLAGSGCPWTPDHVTRLAVVHPIADLHAWTGRRLVSLLRQRLGLIEHLRSLRAIAFHERPWLLHSFCEALFGAVDAGEGFSQRDGLALTSKLRSSIQSAQRESASAEAASDRAPWHDEYAAVRELLAGGDDSSDTVGGSDGDAEETGLGVSRRSGEVDASRFILQVEDFTSDDATWIQRGFRLRYSVPWPLSSVIGREVLASYDAVFHLLLRIRQVHTRLVDRHRDMREDAGRIRRALSKVDAGALRLAVSTTTLGGASASPRLAHPGAFSDGDSGDHRSLVSGGSSSSSVSWRTSGSVGVAFVSSLQSQLHALQCHSFAALGFVASVQSFVFHGLARSDWSAAEKQMQVAGSVSDLCEVHEAALRRTLHNCLLSAPSSWAHEQLMDLFRGAEAFAACAQKAVRRSEDGLRALGTLFPAGRLPGSVEAELENAGPEERVRLAIEATSTVSAATSALREALEAGRRLAESLRVVSRILAARAAAGASHLQPLLAVLDPSAFYASDLRE